MSHLMLKYSPQDCSDILVTAAEGGINYWARTERSMSGDNCVRLDISPMFDPSEFMSKHICVPDVITAMSRVLELYPKTRAAEYIRSGDVGMIDAEAADVIVQVAMFDEIVYG